MPDFDVERLSLIKYPDPRLREKGKPIAEINDTVRRVAERMLELMRVHDGVGLAAQQIGLPWRMFVCNPTGEPEDGRVYLNPRLTNLVGAIDSNEGCLSIPDIHVTVRRAAEVTLLATDLDGRPVELQGRELLARVWQHECDHLDGRLIIDRMTEADKIATRKTLKQLESEYKPSRPKAASKGRRDA